MAVVKITIATVCYNAAKDIEQLIASVCGQDYERLEFIIVDGGSNDGTLDIIKRNKYSITKWISEPDNGVYDAMNKALHIATGDYILFLGVDDHLISSDTISNVVSYMNDSNSIYYGDVYRYPRNDLYRGKFNKYLLACENICHQAIFYPRSVYKNMIYDVKFPIYADYVYNIRNWRTTSFRYIPICISYYCCTGLSGSDDSVEKFNKLMMKEFRSNLGWTAYLIRCVYKLIKLKSS